MKRAVFALLLLACVVQRAAAAAAAAEGGDDGARALLEKHRAQVQKQLEETTAAEAQASSALASVQSSLTSLERTSKERGALLRAGKAQLDKAVAHTRARMAHAAEDARPHTIRARRLRYEASRMRKLEAHKHGMAEDHRRAAGILASKGAAEAGAHYLSHGDRFTGHAGGAAAEAEKLEAKAAKEEAEAARILHWANEVKEVKVTPLWALVLTRCLQRMRERGSAFPNDIIPKSEQGLRWPKTWNGFTDDSVGKLRLDDAELVEHALSAWLSAAQDARSRAKQLRTEAAAPTVAAVLRDRYVSMADKLETAASGAATDVVVWPHVQQQLQAHAKSLSERVAAMQAKKAALTAALAHDNRRLQQM